MDQLEIIKQGLSQEGLHIALNMKHDFPNEWNLFKKNGNIDLILDKSRLPYIAQAFDTTEIEHVMLISKVQNKPASFTVNVNGNETDLARVDELKRCKGINSDIDLDTQFTLSVSNADMLKLEELMLVVKYKL
jgi:hypothetical protein